MQCILRKKFVKPEDISEVPDGFYQWIMDRSDFHDIPQTITKILSQNGNHAAYLCFWKQSSEDESIPFLVQRYESAVYAYQVEKENCISIPVITVVLYFGKKSGRILLEPKIFLEDLEIFLKKYYATAKVTK